MSWAKRSEASTRSHISDRASLVSSIPGGPEGDIKLTPQQYGVLGEFFIFFMFNNYFGIEIRDVKFFY